MPITKEEVADIDNKLRKRGFHRNDPLAHQCPACQAQAVLKYSISGPSGGRDISLCQACGVATSWRSRAGFTQREQDTGFDLRVFLR